jgi:crossover junction endodeoxyribonuclease RusA
MTSYRKDGLVPSSHPAPVAPEPNPLRRGLPARRAAGAPRGAGQVVSPSASVFADRLVLTLPAPPSVNHQYATVNGRRILSAAGRAYKHAVGRDILVALTKSPHREEFLSTAHAHPLALSIHFYFTSPLRRDVDGGLKIAQDALCEALGINDNRVREIHLFKAQDTARPRIEVLLSPSL